MSDVNDELDPLTAAFANPKAGKKLKPGEVLPGMEASSQRTNVMDDVRAAPDAELSNALDDAFSNPNFGSERVPSQAPQPAYKKDHAAIDAKIARDLDDAFANPKVGNKIEDGAHLGTSGLESLGLDATRLDDLQSDHMPAKSGGIFGPKFLVITLVLGAVAVAVLMSGAQTGSTPTIIRLD